MFKMGCIFMFMFTYLWFFMCFYAYLCILYHIISFYIILYYIISFYFILFHFIWFYMILYDFIWFLGDFLSRSVRKWSSPGRVHMQSDNACACFVKVHFFEKSWLREAAGVTFGRFVSIWGSILGLNSALFYIFDGVFDRWETNAK